MKAEIDLKQDLKFSQENKYKLEPTDSTIGLGYFEIQTLQNLQADGLKACHLRAWHGPKYFSSYHEKALRYLLRECGYSPDKAIAEISGLDLPQVEYISRGYSRNDLIGLQSFQITAVDECKHFGLTAEHLRVLFPQDRWFHGGHCNTLKFLFENYGMRPEDAIKELNGLTEEQISYISVCKKLPNTLKTLISPSRMNLSLFSSSTPPSITVEATTSPLSCEESTSLDGLTSRIH